METLIRRVAGMDVHAQSVEVCVRVVDDKDRVHQTVRRFATMTADLRALGKWLSSQGVTHVAMESTGVYWKPIFNILEERFTVLLCNARHIKHVPGRKTDAKDCQWIAQLLQYGLLHGSFIPPRAQRDLRDLTRHRAQLAGEQTRVKNRMQKILEDANIKLSEVASDPLGVSGQLMLKELIKGQTNPEVLAELAQRRMREKIPQLRLALDGHLTEHHRFMLSKLMKHLEFLEQQMADLDLRIQGMIDSPPLTPPDGGGANQAPADEASQPQSATTLPPAPLGFQQALELLVNSTGIAQTSACALLAEVGTNMAQFPSAKHLASQARICPGTEESAGKRKSGKTGKANRWLRRVLTQCAWAASRAKHSYFSAQFAQIAKRRGKRRAIVAVGHALLIVIYHMLKHHKSYQDLGADFFDKIDPVRKTRYHVKRLEELGHKVILEKAA